MIIQAQFISKVQPLGSQEQSIFYDMRGWDGINVHYRRIEVKSPQNISAASWLATHYTTEQLWDGAQEITEGSFIAAWERLLEDYYYNILQTMVTAQPTINTVDEVIDLGQEAFGYVPVKQAELNAWLQLVGLSEPIAPEDDVVEVLNRLRKSQMVIAMMLFPPIGLLAGGIRDRNT